jgi:hypothetical protein
VDETGEDPRQRCIFAFSLLVLLKWLPPTQTKDIPGCQSKTPAAQMHFASDLPLSQCSHSIIGQNLTIKAKYRMNHF